ncbi:unnamed protein product [Paramecium pentaurelia]|uniref:Uncharacterized protein n=1 Tax=Paramecium pentaurelia TaxID=43138 RepID=A0A8S1S6M2_9CILI|nr:unnamed protein product [Paramecium pentaurelia]
MIWKQICHKQFVQEISYIEIFISAEKILWDFTSLEVTFTIRQEYPNIKINLIDPNNESLFLVQNGHEFTNLILNLQVEKGINIYENIPSSSKVIKSDVVIQFSSTELPKTEFAEVSDHQFEFDTAGRVKVDQYQRTEIKSIFAACNYVFYTNGIGHIGNQFQACYNQGITEDLKKWNFIIYDEILPQLMKELDEKMSDLKNGKYSTRAIEAAVRKNKNLI